MSDEDHMRATMRFEDIVIEDVTDHADLLADLPKGHVADESTDPCRKALVIDRFAERVQINGTIAGRVSTELLVRSKRQIDEDWIECEATVGRNGIVRLAADTAEIFYPGEKVVVRIKRE